MSNWNADQYLKFSDERTRAAADLAVRVRLESPRTVVDLGCGPGNSTQVLRARWPQADLTGVDSSPEMIAAARSRYPDQQWQFGDVATWQPAEPVDLVYSNATVHWLPRHESLIPRLFQAVAPGGALAFQLPSSEYPLVRRLIYDISREPAWDERMASARTMLTMHPPAFYYDLLAGSAAAVDLWETEYYHVLDSPGAIVEWFSSAGLRPFLAALDSEDDRQSFLSELHERVAQVYVPRQNGKVLFPFRRTFVIAYRHPAN